MGERIQIEIDTGTQRGVEALRTYITTLDEAQKKTADLVASSEKATTATAGVGKAATATSAELKKLDTSAGAAAKSISTTGDKATESGAKLKTLHDPAGQLDNDFNSLAKSTGAWVASFAGLSAVLALMRKMQEELAEVERIRNRLIEGKAGIDTTIQGFLANLGLPNTAAGQDQARTILTTLKQRVPQAPINVITGIAGQVQAFGRDVTAPGAGQDLTALLAGFAASMQLSPEEAQAIPTVLSATGAMDPKRATRVLAQIQAAQRTTAIPNQADFTKQFLRLGAQLIPQGMSIQDVAGLLAGSAGGATDARVVGSNAEQVMRAAMGKDPKSQAALGRAAAAQGVITPAQLAAADKAVPLTETERDRQQAIDKETREIADTEADMARTRARAAGEAKLRQDRIAQAKTPVAREAATAANKAAEDAAAQRERDQTQSIADRRQSIADNQRKQAKSRADAAFARVFRGLGAGARLAVVRQATVGMTPAQRAEFFTQQMGASSEEVGALNVLTTTGAGGFQAAQAAVQGVGAGQEAELQQGIEGYAGSPLGRATAARDAIALQEAGAVRTDEEEQKFFRERSRSRAEILIKNWADLPEAAKDATGLRGMTNDRTKLIVYARDVSQQIYRFYSEMSEEERAAYPEIPDMLAALQKYVNSPIENAFFEGQVYAQIDSLYRAFVRITRKLARERLQGTRKKRTVTPPPQLYMTSEGRGTRDAGAGVLGASSPLIGPEALQPDVFERATGSAVPPAPNIPEPENPRPAPGATTQPTTQPSARAAGPTFNIDIGNYFVQPGGALDFPGRGEGNFG